ncbi:MAG: InlB B-repeat-containing protein [Oscillospiraceae bacterium]
MKRRLFSAFLALCLMATLLPATIFGTAAASDTGTTDMNALSALGIDTSKAPSGYDENSKSNPYGKDTVTLNPVGEIYRVGLDTVTATNGNMPAKDAGRQTTRVNTLTQSLSGTIYGHNKHSLNSKNIMAESNADKVEIAAGTSEVTGSYIASEAVTNAPSALQKIETETTVGGKKIALTAVAAGNFDGNTAGRKAQAAMLYTTKLDKSGGLYLKFGDIAGTYGTGEVQLLAQTANIGNPSASMDGRIIETFNTDPYLMQNYLQMTTGDYDGDGRDEIAVYIPEYGKSRIEVYTLKKTSQGSDYKDAGQWTISWTYPLKETSYVSNMVSLVSGDFNSDGVDDLAATWGYYYGPQDNKGSTAVVLFGSAENGKMLQKSQEFPLNYGTSDIVRGAFAYGDITGGGANTLILGGQLNGDLAAGNINSRFVGFYVWDGGKFVQTQAENYDLFSKNDDGDLIYPAMTRSEGAVFYSSPLCVSNVDVVGQGLGNKAMLYLDSLTFEYDDSGLLLTGTGDKTFMQSNQSSPVSYVEYGAVATDLEGLGRETVVTMRQTFSSTTTEEVSQVVPAQTYTYYVSESYYKSWAHKLIGWKSWRMVEKTVTLSEESLLTDTNVYYHPGAAYQTTIYLYPGEKYTANKNVDVSASICIANTDSDTTYLKYEGKHFVYSDPEILAVLASPPYFGDLLDRSDLSGSYGDSSTSYASTKGGGTGLSASTTISAGAYVSVEQEFSIFGISAVKAEAEVAVTAGFTFEYEHSSSLEQTVSYSTSAGEDKVAFYSIPLEVFTYSASVPDENGVYQTQTMTVNIPHEAAVKLLSLDDYEAIAADYDVLPRIADNVLTHTLGDPGSYPSSTNGYRVIAKYEGPPASVGFSTSGAAIGQEIAMSEENNTAFSATVGIETKIGAGAGGVVVGVTLGSETGAGYVTTTTSGSSFSGELQDMPVEAKEYSYGYNWRIFAYNYKRGSSSFPVVSYVVSDVTAPPSLPTDFEQDVARTGNDKAVLTWSYDKSVAGFQLYRYYEFPEGSGSYELAFVPASEGIRGADGKLYYSYTDENLAPYTDYRYQIQTVRAAVPNNSIKSEVLLAKTKTAKGYPNITLTGDGLVNNVLPIYPDATSKVTANVANEGDYSGGLSYQWQVLTGNGWSSMAGQNTKTLSFVSAGSADQARYRCRVNAIYRDAAAGQDQPYYITAYSETLSTAYNRRTAIVFDNKGVGATAAGNQISLSLSLISAHTGHNTAPTGTVTFIISGMDYYATATGALAADGTTSGGKSITTANATVKNLKDGVYEVTAVYNGSRIFKTLTISEAKTVLIGNATGYQLNLTKGSEVLTSFVYGDSVVPVLHQVEQVGGEVTKTPTTDDVSYEILDSTGQKVNSGILTGAYDTPDVGRYTLVAKIGTNEAARREFTVTPRPLTVAVPDQSIGAGNVSGNQPQIIITDGTMAFAEKLADLGLIVIAKNSADTIVTLDDSTKPGNYTVTPAPGTSSEIENYTISYTSGIFTVTAQTYKVTCEAEKFQGALAGTAALTNSGEMFSASVDLLFSAAPYNGYVIDTWTVRRADTSALILTDKSGKSTLHYTMQDEPIHVAVTFKKALMTLQTFVQGGGTIATPPYFTSGAVVTTGAEMDFTAVPSPGYHFSKWEKIENNVPTQLSGTQNDDGSNTLRFTMGTFGVKLYAYFERDSYSLTLGDNLKASYLWDDDGLSITPEIEVEVGNGASIVGGTELTVCPKAGYVIPEAADWQQSGSETGTAAGDNQSYTFAMTEDTAVSVETIRGTYGVTISAQNGAIRAMLNETEADAAALSAIPGGSRLTLTATPDYGYAFDFWEVNGARSPQADSTYVRSELGENLAVVAHFKALEPYKANVVLNNPLRASFTYTIVDAIGRTQASNVPVGPVSGGNTIDVFAGDTLTIAVTPQSNFMVGKWIINGDVVDSRQKTYTFENISANQEVQIDLAAQSSHIVTYSAGISGATTDGTPFESGAYVGGGTTVVFQAAPESGKMVKGWTLNGAPVLNEHGASLVTDTYTIDGLAGNADVNVTFEDKAFHSVTLNTQNMTAQADIAPLLDGKIRDGATGVFSLTAREGYRLTKADIEALHIFDTISEPDATGKYTCVIRSIESDVTVTLGAKKIYTVTAETAANGTVSALPETAVAGETVTVTAAPVSDKFKLETLRAFYLNDQSEETDLTLTDNTFVMPAADVTVTASFQRVDGGGGGTPTEPEKETFVVTAAAGWGGKISPESLSVESGGKASFTITPNEGYKVEDVKVDGKSVGAVNSYTIDEVTADAAISATFKKDITLPDINAWDNPFPDVSKDDWFYESVGFVTQMGMFKGLGDGTFGAGHPTTRAMLVTVLYRFENPPEKGSGSFDDVSPDAWYADAVSWAAEHGVVAGIGGNLFNPDGSITREQMATILYRYSKLIGRGDAETADLDGFKDAGEVSDFAEEAMSWAVGAGLITGKGNGILDPKGEATRAEVATILMRFIRMLAE